MADNSNVPHIIEFSKIGNEELGFLSIAEATKQVPFDIKRIFWTYSTPEEIVRGRHAHYDTEMILIAMSGRIVVNTEMPNGDLNVFTLDKPNVGLFMPKLCWHTMVYSKNPVQMVIASSLYDEADYIRDYETFLKLRK
jgi:hypothetical protein